MRGFADAALVLAGGRGERLWPLTASRPKPLLPLPGDETIVSRLVRQVSRLAERVYVLAPPGKAELFQRELGRRALVVEQDEYSMGYGSGAAALSALKRMERSGAFERLLVVYGDLVVSDEVFDLLASRGEGYYVLGFRTERDGRRYGVLVVEDGLLKSIVEKPGWSGSIVANAGIYLLPGRELIEVLETLEPSERGELEFTDAVSMLARRHAIRVLEVNEDNIVDTGTWWDYLRAARRVLEWLAYSGECRVKPRGATLAGGVVCGHEPRVTPPVVIEGPVWVGRNVSLGPFTRLRPYTILLDGVELGAFVEVKASILMEGVKAHHHAYIGDSVVGEYSNIAAGTIFANLRHDGMSVKSCAKGVRVDTGMRKLGAVLGARVKTGVNSSILPGTRIGPCTWIEPGSVVKGDVPACSFYRRDDRIVRLEARTREIRECCASIEYGEGVGLCIGG